MARSKYKADKRQKEIAREKKQELKRQQKLEKKRGELTEEFEGEEALDASQDAPTADDSAAEDAPEREPAA